MGGVATTSLATTTRNGRYSGRRAAHALRASTTRSAVTGRAPSAPRPPAERSIRVMGECSKMRMPRSIATRAQPAHQMAGLHDRRGRLEDPGEMRRRARPARDLRQPRAARTARQAGLLELGEGVVPRPDLSRAGRRPEPPPVVVVGVDSVGLAELADLGDAIRRRLGQPGRLLDAAGLCEAAELRPPAHHEAAVAPAGAAAAHVGLEDHDVERGVELGQPQRGPQAGEPAADDAHVRRDRPRQRAGRVVAGPRCERLPEPERAVRLHGHKCPRSSRVTASIQGRSRRPRGRWPGRPSRPATAR